jgi:pyruvate/2-oxoglutarate dehydrogenase complex dihydrolipoamide dehydrogenase (E3) component
MSTTIFPDDEHNRTLAANVHPPKWVNPTPAGPYHLVVIGAGTAGLVTAAIAAALGAKVALIEKALMGGDCLNVGCVPSKAILRAARAWAALRGAEPFGFKIPSALRGDFGAVMARMRRLRAAISPNDSAQRFTTLGVDVYFGQAHFTGPQRLEVGDRILRFSKAAICTGARAAVPPIPGLREAGSLTNESVFSLTELPPRLAVIGAGPIGCELAQAFARLGSRVTVLEQGDRLLPRDDPDAAAIVRTRMERDGVQFVFHAAIHRVQRREGSTILSTTIDGRSQELIVDQVLVAAGRAPNVDGLGLEQAGVAYDATRGVTVNDRLQTTNPRIYAAGDICSSYQFTHAADAQAQIVIQNALFPHPFGLGCASATALLIPWCTYTEPEVAHVGLSPVEARARGIAIDSYTHPLDEVDRAILDGETEGFVRLHVKKNTDAIVGATIVSAHAGELISQISLAMKAGIGLKTITATIYPYPTQAEAIKKAATAWRKTTLTDGKKAILRTWFRWTR